MKLRVRFSKTGKIRFIGHRDVARVAERAVRKIGLPVAYSEGFSPRMRLSFGLALPTGYESDGEYVDLPLVPAALADGVISCGAVTHLACLIEADKPNGPDGCGGSYCTLGAALGDAMPVGMDVSSVVLIERGGPSLQSTVQACTWRFDIAGLSVGDAQRAVERLLASECVEVTRMHKGKAVTDDVRPGVAALSAIGETSRGAELVAELSATPRVVRPSELVTALSDGHEMGIARRTHQWNCTAGVRAEPATPARCLTNRQRKCVSE